MPTRLRKDYTRSNSIAVSARTLEACWDLSHAYAFFCVRLGGSVARTVVLIPYLFQGYAKGAYSWLSSWHRCAVRSDPLYSPGYLRMNRTRMVTGEGVG